MSWIDLAQDKLIIVTGDGSQYEPLWKEPSMAIEFNVAQFEFPGIKGSLVKRNLRKGVKYPLEIYFTGEDHLNDLAKFKISCDDERHWVVTHPYYGKFNAQPTAINIDNTQGNVTKISINLIETIVENNPKRIVTPPDDVLQGGLTLSEKSGNAILTNISSPGALEKNIMQTNINKIYTEGKKRIKAIDAEKYLNLYNKATTAILNATNDVSRAIQTIQAMIDAPFQFIDTVRNRFNTIRNQFKKLVTSIETIASQFKTPNARRIYEHDAANTISTMAKALVTTIDYASAEEVLEIMASLISVYDEFVENIDALQTENGGQVDSYVPDAETMVALQNLVNYTVANLYEIALDSKQERQIILESDTNIVELAHRLYGLQPDDSTIEYLCNTNNFAMNDLLQLEAGRKVKYYV